MSTTKVERRIIEIETLRVRLRKTYQSFYAEGFEPMTFGEAFPIILIHVLEKIIYGYSSTENRMLALFSTPELGLSDTDAFLSLCKETSEDFLAKKSNERLYNFYTWEVANDQRSLTLFKDLHL